MLTPAEVRALLRVSRTTFYRMVEQGELAAVRLGGPGAALRIPAAELERWLEALGEPVAKREAYWENGKTDFVGPGFDAAWEGTPEAAERDRKVKQYAKDLGRRLRPNE